MRASTQVTLRQMEELFGDRELVVPDELLGGAYANFLSVWLSPYEFTLDFAVALGAEEEAPPYGVVARVKIPAALLFDVMRSLNEAMARYEQRFGEIRRPGDTA